MEPAQSSIRNTVTQQLEGELPKSLKLQGSQEIRHKISLCITLANSNTKMLTHAIRLLRTKLQKRVSQNIFQYICIQAEELAQQLTALAILVDDLGLIPSTHTVAQNHLQLQFNTLF